MLPYEYLIHWGLMMQYSDILWVNIGSGNGLLSDGTKPLLQPIINVILWFCCIYLGEI